MVKQLDTKPLFQLVALPIASHSIWDILVVAYTHTNTTFILVNNR